MIKNKDVVDFKPKGKADRTVATFEISTATYNDSTVTYSSTTQTYGGADTVVDIGPRNLDVVNI